jgi:predicted transcriptional regulator
MKKTINIQIDKQILKELDIYAKEMERTRTYLIDKAVLSYLNTLDEIISDKRISDVKTGKEEVLSLEDTARRIGL